MELFIGAFIILTIAVLAMAVGVVLSDRKIQGSCGGLAALGMEKACDCDKPCERRLQRQRESEQNVEFGNDPTR